MIFRKTTKPLLHLNLTSTSRKMSDIPIKYPLLKWSRLMKNRKNNSRSKVVSNSSVAGRWTSLRHLPEMYCCQSNQLRRNISSRCRTTSMKIIRCSHGKIVRGIISICSATMTWIRWATKAQQWIRTETFCTHTRSSKKLWSRTRAAKWVQITLRVPKTTCAQLLPCSNTLLRGWTKNFFVTHYNNLVSLIF